MALSGFGLAHSASGDDLLDVTPEMVAMFQAAPALEPDYAADCRYANEVRHTLAKRHDIEIRGEQDFKLAKQSKVSANVWAIIMVREANRVGVDPSKVIGPIQKKYSQRKYKGPQLSVFDALIEVANNCDAVLSGSNNKVMQASEAAK